VVVDPGSGGAATAAPVCAGVDQLNVDGTLDGLPAHAEAKWESVGGVGTGFEVTTLGAGVLYARFASKGTSLSDPPTSELGWLRLPPASTEAGWLCNDALTNLDEVYLDGGSNATASWTRVHRLGACPGTPVDGSLTLTGLGSPAYLSVSGTLAGTPVSMTAGSGGLSQDRIAVDLGDGGFLYVDLSSHPILAEIIMPRDSVDPDVIYCVGTVVPNGASLTFGDLSRLPHCGDTPVAGSLGICVTE
jgi:hypothetical protein